MPEILLAYKLKKGFLMKVNKVVIAAALAMASVSSFADSFSGTLTLPGGTEAFGRSPLGPSFTDTYTFTLAGSSFLTSSSVTSAVVGAADIDFTGVFFNNILTPATHIDFAMFLGDPFETYGVANLLLAAGTYELHINGSQTPTRASYGGNLTVTAAIPEPETYALMLAGLGAMGFMARRRKNA